VTFGDAFDASARRSVMLRLTGAVFLAIGLATGAALVLMPFGMVPSGPSSAAAWLLFPGCFIAGSLLLALGAPQASIGWLWRICAASLLVLAVAAAIALALPVLGMLDPARQTISLWYVLFLSGAFGTACALASSAPAPS
jgi:hypothetical protein